MRIWCISVACLCGLVYAQDTVEKGTLTVHSLLHAIGEERYLVKRSADGLVMDVSFETSDRGNKRSGSASLTLKSDLTPLRYDLKSRTDESFVVELLRLPDSLWASEEHRTRFR